MLLTESKSRAKKLAAEYTKLIMKQIKGCIENNFNPIGYEIKFTDHPQMDLHVRFVEGRIGVDGEMRCMPTLEDKYIIDIRIYLPKDFIPEIPLEPEVKKEPVISQLKDLILTVLTHESVHLFQSFDNGKPTSKKTTNFTGKLDSVEDFIKYLSEPSEIQAYAEEAYHSARNEYRIWKKRNKQGTYKTANKILSIRIGSMVKPYFIKENPHLSNDEIKNLMINTMRPVVYKMYDYLYDKYPNSNLLRPRKHTVSEDVEIILNSKKFLLEAGDKISIKPKIKIDRKKFPATLG